MTIASGTQIVAMSAARRAVAWSAMRSFMIRIPFG
jgi:hypothetical protein